MKRCIIAALVLASSVYAGNDRYDDRYDSGRNRYNNNNNDNGSASAFGLGALAGIGAGVINGASGTAAGIGAGLGLGLGGVNLGNGGNSRGNSNSGGLLGGLVGGDKHDTPTLSGLGIGLGGGIGIGAIQADADGRDRDNNRDNRGRSNNCPVGEYYDERERCCKPLSSTCPADQVYSPTERCCKPRCTKTNEVFDFADNRCACANGFEYNGNRDCVPISTPIVCTDPLMQPDGNTCKCKSPFISDGAGSCKCPNAPQIPSSDYKKCECKGIFKADPADNTGTKCLCKDELKTVVGYQCKCLDPFEDDSYTGSCKCKDSKKEVSGTTCKCKKFFTDVYGTCECRGDLVEPDGEDECKCKYGVGKRTHVCLDKCKPISFATEECYCDPAKNNQFYFWGKRFCLPKCKYNEVRYADLSSDKHGGDRSYTCTWCRNDGHSYYSQKDMKCYCDANGGYRSVGGMCVKDSDYTETYPTSPASSLTMTTMRVASPSTSRHTDSSVGCASGFRQCTVSQPEGPTTYCYNPQVHACVKLSSGASLICPANANAACGNGCYDPTLFACQSGGLVAL